MKVLTFSDPFRVPIIYGIGIGYVKYNNAFLVPSNGLRGSWWRPAFEALSCGRDRVSLDASQRAMIAAKLAGSSFTIPLLDRGSLLWRGLVGLRHGLPFRRQHVEA